MKANIKVVSFSVEIPAFTWLVIDYNDFDQVEHKQLHLYSLYVRLNILCRDQAAPCT